MIYTKKKEYNNKRITKLKRNSEKKIISSLHMKAFNTLMRYMYHCMYIYTIVIII